MRIIVTGGCGFIGSHFVKLLRRERPDAQIMVVDKLTYAGNCDNLREELKDLRLQLLVGDIARDWTIRRFDKFLPDATHIVNFAAESFVDASIHGSRTPFVTSNILGAQKILDWVTERQGVRLLHVSTDEVYGDLPLEGGKKFTEETPLSPNNPYAASKASADMLVQSYVHTFGINALITRCSNNYGPNQFPEKFIPRMILQALGDDPLPVYGKGLNVRDWIHVEDHCRGVLKALELGEDGEIYNFGGNAEMRNIDVAHQILDILGKPVALIEYVTDRPGHDRRYSVDTTRTEHILGWRPEHSFQDGGLEATIQWYVDNPQWIERIQSGHYRMSVPRHAHDNRMYVI